MTQTFCRVVSAMLWLSVAASLAGPVHAGGVDPVKATLVQREQAQSLFIKGRKLFERKEYGEALEAFRASHQIVASPNTRLLMARCLRAADRLVEAYVEFGRAAIEAREMEVSDPRYARAARSAAAERRALENELGFLNVTVEDADASSTLSVAGEMIKRPAWTEPVPVAPGEVKVSVQTDGYEPIEETIVAEAGKPVEVTIKAKGKLLPKADAVKSRTLKDKPVKQTAVSTNLLPYAYVAGGVGVAGIATFAVAGLMARSQFNDLSSSCQGPCPPERQDEIDDGRRKQTIANVGLAIGVIGLGVGTYLYLISDDDPEGAKAGLVLSPGWIGVRGEM